MSAPAGTPTWTLFFNSTNTATQNINNLVASLKIGWVHSTIIVVIYEIGVGVVKPLQSLCRTSCCWETSTQTATMWWALTGRRSASSQTRASTGWSATRPTLPCRTPTALMTGRHTDRQWHKVHAHRLLTPPLFLYLQDRGHHWHVEGSVAGQR